MVWELSRDESYIAVMKSIPSSGLSMNYSKRLAVAFSSISIVLTAILVATGSSAQPQPAKTATVFSQPKVQMVLSLLRPQITAAFASDNYELARSLTEQCLKVAPDDASSLFNLACAEARLGNTDSAMLSLRRSIGLGFRNVDHLANDEDLASLRTHAEWPALLKLAAEPYEMPEQPALRPALILDGVAVVDVSNTEWDATANRFRVQVAEASQQTRELPISTGTAPVDRFLNQWQKEETAVGLANVLYDNHDRDHSDLNWKRFPQLTRIEYSQAAKSENLDNGLQYRFEFSRTTFGNSSTAMVGSPYWRSQPRQALVDGPATLQLLSQYFRNHLYVYPEHKDYDPGRNGNGGFGDVYPVNTPFVLISQGSSYSDKPFLEAIASTLAAFRPEVMAKLESNGLVSPCLQMIVRRSLKKVKNDRTYLSGFAHPVVFEGSELDPVQMAHMAHNMTADNIPPIALLGVVKETESVVGRDYFEVAPRVNMYTCPVSISRVFRPVSQEMSITVDAGKSTDVNGKKLTWDWVVLQGDVEKIEIKKLNPEGSAATISIKHHERRPIRRGAKMESSRIDIGVFVNNGTYYSPPAIISYYCPENEHRIYDSAGRIQSVQYTDFANGGDYADPLIVNAKDWRDEYHYSDTGQLKGWTRHRGDQRQEFTPDGALITSSDSLGRPLTVATVRYVAQPRPDQAAILTQVAGNEVIEFTYSSDTDFVGSSRIQTIE